MKYLLVASSSGGHVYPCLSFGNYLKKIGNEVSYLGIKGEIEEKIIKNNIELYSLPKSFKHFIKNPFLYKNELKRLKCYLNKFDIIVAFGGFITLICSFFNKKRNLYLHDSNFIIGDSNLISLIKANLIFTAYDLTFKYKYCKFKFVGNPCSDDLNSYKKNDYITFMFGSLGSKTLIKKTIYFLLNQNLNEKFMLITSNIDIENYIECLKHKRNVIVIPYIDRQYLYQNTKILFSRGGGSTIAEIIKTKTNAVIIPSPYVKNNHQYYNAKYYEERKVVNLIKEEDYNESSIKEYINKFNNKYIKEQRDIIKNYIKDNVCIKMNEMILNDYYKRKI